MPSPIEARITEPKPLDEQVFDILSETRQVLASTEHRFGSSFGENSHEDDLSRAVAALDSDQLDVVLKNIQPSVDEAGPLRILETELGAWQNEEGGRKLKTLISATYASRQSEKIIGLLRGKRVTVRDLGATTNPAIVAVSNGERLEQASGFVQGINALTGLMHLRGSEGQFELDAPEWSVTVVALIDGSRCVDLEVHDDQ